MKNMSASLSVATRETWPSGDSELATLIKAFDWESTGLGPLPQWPDNLCASIDIILRSPLPMVMLWGPGGIMIYNDAYSGFAGQRHPKLLGSQVLKGWPEVAEFNANVMKVCFHEGKTLTFHDQHLTLYRNNRPEDVWLNLYYSPITDKTGRPDGVLAVVVETSQRVMEEQKRKLTEEALLQSQQRMEVALAASQVLGIWDWDIIHDKVTMDSRLGALFNLTPEHSRHGVKLSTVISTIHPEDRPRIEAAIRNIIRHGGTYSEEHRLIQLDGSIRWLSVSGNVQRDAADTPQRFFGVGIEVTAEHEALNALRQSEQRFRLLSTLDELIRDIQNPWEVMQIITRQLADHFEVSRCAYADMDDDDIHMTVPFEYPVTLDKKSIVGQYVLNDFGEDTAARLRSGKTLVISDYMKEMPHNAERFAAFDIRATICYPFIKSGKLKAMIAVHQNTKRKWTSYEIDLLEQIAERSWAYIERARSDMKLRESEENFRQLANAMPQVVWTAKVNGQLDYINDRVYDYSGDIRWTEEGIDWLTLIHPEDQASSMRAWAQCLATGALYEVEQRVFFKPTGTYRWNLTRAVPIRNEQGVIIKWFGANTDIEDQKRAADEIREAKEAAEGASIAKSEFLANMSHEIRTPMNAVIGLSHILALSKPLTEKQKEYIHTLRLSADSLLALINDLLDISRIESHSIELERVSFSVVALMKDIFSMMNVRAQEKGLHFTMESECECIEKRTFIGDPHRIRQIILNLCSNAIKFTETGSVHITIRCEPVDQGKEKILLTIKDTGIGIEPEKRATIFQKFVQADTSINRKYGGTGLGLAISKTLAEIMGGDIHVQSEVGTGSAFTLSLPLTVADVSQ